MREDRESRCRVTAGSAGPLGGRVGARRRRAKAGLVCGGVLSLGVLALPAGPASASLLGTSPYVVGVLGTSGSALALSDVASVGGQVVETLDAANAVLAQLSSSEVSALEALPGVVVTPDVAVSVQGSSYSDPPHTGSDVFVQQTQATVVWNHGDTGTGVNVAVLDTGIDPLPDFAGRLVGGVDLSGGGNPFQDGYGHGTFDAGLVAGDGASSGGQYTGEAPGAGLVSVKVAGASGMTDLATVIAGVGWTIDNRQALHIGVLNMSLGYAPLESSALDPLDIAVENAWRDGIVVVTSAGNAGPYNGSIVSPGDDPLVVTVGALDDLAQPAVSKDVMTTFSSVGPTNPDGWLKPDLVTSGRSVVSLAAPGSTIDDDYPSARVGAANFVGSGTSFATAITSGAAAMVLEAHPGDTPDQVKAALLASTNPGPVGNPVVDGHGALDVDGAVSDPPNDLTQHPSALAVPMGATVGLYSTWGQSSWDPANWASPPSAGTPQNGQSFSSWSWDGTTWDGWSWDGWSWDGWSWDGWSWDAATWAGTAWDGWSWDGWSWDGWSWDGWSWDSSGWE
jgi:serine protease AprX